MLIIKTVSKILPSKIIQESTFTFENGDTGQIVDATFNAEPIEEESEVQHSNLG